MKEKLKRYLAKITKKHIIIGIVFIIIGLIVFNYIQEQKNIAIDEYNFQQFEKIKMVLNPLPKNSYKFDNIFDFNKQFNQNIIPIKNCYYFLDKNSHFVSQKHINKEWAGYIFGFKFESKKYIKQYEEEYFVYPQYDLPTQRMCLGGVNLHKTLWQSIDEFIKDTKTGDSCTDINKIDFIDVIEKPCTIYERLSGN